MSEAVIVAVVTAGLSLIGTIITVVTANRQTIAALDKRSELADRELEGKLEKWQAVTDTKIDALSAKVEKHNNLIERTYILEGAVQELQHDVRDLKEGK